jgi:molecular chaperone DnaJ
MSKDWYQIIDVPRDATDEEILKKYRKLAKQYHPDRNPGDKAAEDMFKEVQSAFEVLGDPVKRREYDQWGSVSKEPPPWVRHDPMDIFEDLFNFKRTEPPVGRDVEAEVTVSFMEAVYGCRKTVEFDRRETCSSCKGTGARDGEELKECVVCDGKGKTFQRFGGGGGFIKVESTCSSCRGTGKVISAFCTDCHARGFISKDTQIDIDIPAGIADGMRLCLRGQGDKGLNAKLGNLICTVKIAPHPLFQRVGRDIQMTVPVGYTMATLGGKIEVPYPFGRADLVIPPGTRSGTMFKLHGLGLPDIQGGTGNMLVRVEVDIPKTLGNEYKELLERLANIEKVNISPGIQDFNEKVTLMYED